MGWRLSASVGLADDGTQCANNGGDQQQVAELLHAVGLPAGGTSYDTLPPVESGSASPELCEAIRGFQMLQGLTDDARVDVDGATWQRLLALAAPENSPVGGVPLLLVASDLNVVELPATATGLPSLTYTLIGPGATWEGPGFRARLSVQGPIKVDWGSSYPVACTMSPNFAALDAAVASGSARSVGGAALDSLCSQVKVESKTAIGSMFAAVSLRLGADGTPVLGGSIGDDTGFQSLGFDPIERAITYRTTKSILKSHPVTGGDVRLSGDLVLELKVTADEGEFEASLIANLVTAATIGFVLIPAVEWMSSEAASGVGSRVVKEILMRFAPVAR